METLPARHFRSAVRRRKLAANGFRLGPDKEYRKC